MKPFTRSLAAVATHVTVIGSTIAIAQATLYKRIGGYDAIAAVVDDFVPRIATDPQLGKYFVGAGKALYFDAPAQAASTAARTDLEMVEDGWTDAVKAFRTAMSEVGLEQLLTQWKAAQGAAALVASVAPGPRPEAAPPTTGSIAAAPCR